MKLKSKRSINRRSQPLTHSTRQEPKITSTEVLLSLQKQYGNKAFLQLLNSDRQKRFQRRAGVINQQKNKSGVVNMEPTEIKGDTGNFNLKAASGIKNALLTAKINANAYATLIGTACKQFENYAEGKIKELEGEVSAAELGAALISVAGTVIGGGLAGKIATEAGKAVANAIASELNGKIKDESKKALSNSKDADDLKKVVNALVLGAGDKGIIIQDKVKKIFQPKVDTIIQKLNNRQNLNTEEDDLTSAFYMALPSATDRYVEMYFGIPSTQNAKESHIKLYKGLVQKFEEQRIVAQATFRERLEMGFAEMPGMYNEKLTKAYKARKLAEKEAANRRKALKKEYSHHSTMLKRFMSSQPSLAQQSKFQLTRQYGNSYVRRPILLHKQQVAENQVNGELVRRQIEVGEETFQAKLNGKGLHVQPLEFAPIQRQEDGTKVDIKIKELLSKMEDAKNKANAGWAIGPLKTLLLDVETELKKLIGQNVPESAKKYVRKIKGIAIIIIAIGLREKNEWLQAAAIKVRAAADALL